MTKDETVWVIPRTGTGRTPKLHTDKGCPQLKGRREPLERPRSHVPNHEICTRCAGEYDPKQTGGSNALSDRLSKTDPEELGLSPLESDRE